jgi:glycerophosphoryl diester phosphodiesterase
MSGNIIVAHRGNVFGKNEQLENTITALIETAELYCSMEIDVRLTKDGIPICWHDHDIKIHGGGKMPVVAVNFNDIKKKHPNICTLTEMLDVAYKNNVPLIIEMKTGMAGVHSILIDSFSHKPKDWREKLEQKLGETVGDVVKQHLQQHPSSVAPYVITSYQKSSIISARNQLSEYKGSILFTKMYCEIPKKWEKKWYSNEDGTVGKNKYNGIHLHLPKKFSKTLPLIRDAIGDNALLVVFTVDDLKKIPQLQHLNIDHIITNNASEALKKLKQLEQPGIAIQQHLTLKVRNH